MCSKLSVLSLTTNELIVHFYLDLIKYQQEETGKENRLGELVVSVGYIKEMAAIEVIVVQARDIGKSVHKLTVYFTSIIPLLWL